MISPTIGRIVWYRPSEHDRLTMAIHSDQPMAATVAHVWSDICVNLSVTDHDGGVHKRSSVALVQGDAGPAPGSSYCEWMPYQKGQAAKAEQLEKQAGP